MMTPQEVSERAFAKASFGGYNMAMVDEFLDQLTADYTALYKENASLKVKMKVLADSVEEYRATEKGMRRALLAAQQEAENMVKEAEGRREELVRAAELEAQARIAQMRREMADEQAKLEAAQRETAAYIEKLRQVCTQQIRLLDDLGDIAAPVVAPAADPVAEAAQEIGDAVQQLFVEEEPEQTAVEIEPETEEEAALEEIQVAPVREFTPISRRDQERARAFDAGEEDVRDRRDSSPTRRIDFDNLQFGSNYDLK